MILPLRAVVARRADAGEYFMTESMDGFFVALTGKWSRESDNLM